MGIDVSKEKLDITLLRNNEKVSYQVVANKEKSLREWYKKFESKTIGFTWVNCLICMEHTGIYNQHFLRIAAEQQWQVCLESAIHIKQSGGLQRGKNDTVDSYRIALYAYKNVDFVKLWQPTREISHMLQNLSSLRNRLIAARTSLTNTIKENALFLPKQIHEKIVDSCKQSIAALNADIAAVEQEISMLIKNDEQLNQLFTQVTSVPGVGTVTALQLIITTGEFKTITDPRKYACYCGVAPFEHSSGSSIRGRTRTSKKANMHLKALLHLCSMSAIQNNIELKSYYEKRVLAGKNKMGVLNAIKNKIIHRVFACVKQNRCYEINHPTHLVLS